MASSSSPSTSRPAAAAGPAASINVIALHAAKHQSDRNTNNAKIKTNDGQLATLLVDVRPTVLLSEVCDLAALIFPSHRRDRVPSPCLTQCSSAPPTKGCHNSTR
jgi:hypothetical protein